VDTPAQAGPDAVLDTAATLARTVAGDVEVRRIAGLGLCAPGPLDARAGLALGIPTLPGFDGLDLRAALKDRLPWPLRIDHDGVAAAFGEWHHGAGRGVADMVYITVSTGIGGGVISDGRVLRGRRGLAGHIGHMKITDSPARCFCGDTGCWEAVASGSALARRAEVRTGRPMRAEEVFSAAGRGAGWAVTLVDDLGDRLGTGIVTLLHLFSPARVVLGGGVMNAYDRLSPAIRAAIDRRAMPAFRDAQLCRTALGDDAGLHGMAGAVLSDNASAEV
jgi:glucokinase